MASVDEQGESLVGIAGDHLNHGSGFDAEAVEIFEQTTVAFEDTDDGGLASCGEFVEGDEATAVAIFLGLEAEGEAVGTVF